MMCAALGAAGVACYLTFRERHWNRALWLANTFLALAFFTHPNGVLPLLTFLFLLLFFDRKRLRARDAAALTPWLALATAWGDTLCGVRIFFWPSLRPMRRRVVGRGGSDLFIPLTR